VCAGVAPALAARHDVATCLKLFGLTLFERDFLQKFE
jgi:hypothetical protein